VPGWLIRDDLRTLAGAASFISCKDRVKWFPEYGCALLALPPHETQAAAGHLSLSLVGLDDWSFHMHRCCQAASECPLPAGSCARSCAILPGCQTMSRHHAGALVLAGQARAHLCCTACPAS
jgi:hypothetical protein